MSKTADQGTGPRHGVRLWLVVAVVNAPGQTTRHCSHHPHETAVPGAVVSAGLPAGK
jgi:hypothetical protein